MNLKFFNGSKIVLYDTNNQNSSSIYYSSQYIVFENSISMSSNVLSPNLNAEFLNGTRSNLLVHNSMSALQGGAADLYYHLTTAQYSQLRTYFISTAEPDVSSGSNGDIWLMYEA